MIINLAFDAIEKDNNLKSILIQLLSASDMRSRFESIDIFLTLCILIDVK